MKVPDAPAAKFFYEANVKPTQRLARLAKEAGVKKFVVYGSYFAYAAEQWPELNLKKQGYPRTRLLQEEVAFLEGEGTMDVMSLRLPYIFGTMPGRDPLWTMFLPQIEGKEHGIHIALTADIQNFDLYIDPHDTMTTLKYNHDDVKASIIETIERAVQATV